MGLGSEIVVGLEGERINEKENWWKTFEKNLFFFHVFGVDQERRRGENLWTKFLVL